MLSRANKIICVKCSVISGRIYKVILLSVLSSSSQSSSPEPSSSYLSNCVQDLNETSLCLSLKKINYHAHICAWGGNEFRKCNVASCILLVFSVTGLSCLKNKKESQGCILKSLPLSTKFFPPILPSKIF